MKIRDSKIRLSHGEAGDLGWFELHNYNDFADIIRTFIGEGYDYTITDYENLPDTLINSKNVDYDVWNLMNNYELKTAEQLTIIMEKEGINSVDTAIEILGEQFREKLEYYIFNHYTLYDTLINEGFDDFWNEFDMDDFEYESGLYSEALNELFDVYDEIQMIANGMD